MTWTTARRRAMSDDSEPSEQAENPFRDVLYQEVNQ
jgi:hypothetical protein